MYVAIYFFRIPDTNNTLLIISRLLSADRSAQQGDHASYRTSETLESAVNTEEQNRKEDKHRGWRGEDIKWDTCNNFSQRSASTVMKRPWFLLCQKTDRRPHHQSDRNEDYNQGCPAGSFLPAACGLISSSSPPRPAKPPRECPGDSCQSDDRGVQHRDARNCASVPRTVRCHSFTQHSVIFSTNTSQHMF